LRPEAAIALAAAEVVAGAAQLGVALTDEQAGSLARYAELLVRWNAVHNLTAISAGPAILSHHLLDSLAIIPSFDVILADRRQARVLDVGSGGGLPGIPLAVARPQWRVTLVDKVQKKVAFLTQAKVELALANIACVHARVEEQKEPAFDLIVSRAFSTIESFVRISRPALAPGGWWAAMKGAEPKGELDQLSKAMPDVRVIDVVRLRVPRLDAERHLVLIQCP
jgi:16S rRNA (guanine527-N7)-methyltransferase